MTGDDQTALAAVVFALLVTICAAGAYAESPRLLAQAMVAECGWEMTDCQPAMAHTIRRTSKRRRVGFDKALTEYCAVFSGPAKGRKRWIRALDGDKQPEGWPKASWKAHLPKWRSARRLSRRFFAGKVADPCKAPAYHFGGLRLAVDVERMRGHERVDCGFTGTQAFWR